ncbi:MAG TPA: AmmeMemoRadiSam system protein B, partial [Rhodospirillales bacterium]|nr:AmmeMemoRadiSam system protein B [Rhodospirillales bacterium]
MTFIRPPAVAGSFYPGNANELERTVRGYMDEAIADPSFDAGALPPKAVVSPHAGYIYSGALAAKVFARLKPAAKTITRVVLLGPCHRV